MKRDDLPNVDETVNDLLARWHRWSRGYTFGKGYPTADIACRQSRTSRQYDDQNGALDAAIEDKIMEAVDSAVYHLEQPYLTAIQVLARNLYCTAQVWRSPRLPADPLERGQLIGEARAMLVTRFIERGLVSRE